MKKPDIPTNDEARLYALNILRILDTEPEQRFDCITRLASNMFDVPIALVSLVDEERQWFKSKVGLAACETSRDISFCGHSINEENHLIVEDATKDIRFFDNPLVTGDLSIRFYTGKVLRDHQGYALGTLCLIDTKPRQFSDENLQSLNDLGSIVERELLALRLAKLDGLTQLLNRIGFVSDTEKLFSSANDVRLKAYYFDLDNFKSLNDSGGHDLGDKALKVFSSGLQASFHHSDLVGRLGGDEFMVVSKAENSSDLNVSDPIAQLDQYLNTNPLYDEGNTSGLSYSWGVTDFIVTPETDFEHILKCADRAMYDQKMRKSDCS
ncbi:sensor domain-containing diguanylate cyclase [Marinomonas balearica]|uniref:sensor domain-containing diguanylate cyclase n=1 Tax=Marinomonas balearica TaxID=491947 RepID=UPI00105D857F|nr:diguanylate cyclase [Marinomonas balearica]